MALSKSNRMLKTDSQPAVPRRGGHPVRVALSSTPGPWRIATGGGGCVHRLRILHGLYGPGSRRVLLEAGLRRGMNASPTSAAVAGLVTALLAELAPDPRGRSSASTRSRRAARPGT